MATWTIRNHDTGEVMDLARDACTAHPEWAHRQCGTSGEDELQAMLDQMRADDYIGRGRDEFGIGLEGYGPALIPHDGANEAFVCRDCMVLIDPVGGIYPGYTRSDCDAGRCPHCGGTDTAWMFAEPDPT